MAIVAIAAAATAGSASATTFCVPDFGPNCPNSGGNVAEADLEKAMGLNGKDGKADRIIIAAGVVKENADYEPLGWENAGSFSPEGSDPLTIVGAGPGSTFLTSDGTGNIFLINFYSNNTRAITMRDLTIQVPASLTDNAGAATQLATNDTLDNVDIVSQNPGSDGVIATGPGNIFRNGEIRGDGVNGTINYGLSADGTSGAGALTVEDATIRKASWALVTNSKGTLTARRVSEIGTRTYGAIVSSGSLTVENSVMTIDDGIGLHASAAADDATLVANHITVANTGGTNPALEGKKFGSGAGDASVTASNSILRGFTSGYRAETAIGPGVGFVKVKARYSNVPSTGSSTNGQIDFTTGNTTADPLLKADFSLPSNSPAIDAGDPAPGGLAVDYLKAIRPVDGNGDGSAIRDMGAFEYQPPVVNPNGPDIPDGPPNTSILKGPGKKLADGIAKFRFKSSEAGSHFQCKLDRGKVTSCKSPKRYKHLKPGRHKFKVWAIDAAGNKDPTPAKRRFRAPA